MFTVLSLDQYCIRIPDVKLSFVHRNCQEYLRKERRGGRGAPSASRCEGPAPPADRCWIFLNTLNMINAQGEGYYPPYTLLLCIPDPVFSWRSDPDLGQLQLDPQPWLYLVIYIMNLPSEMLTKLKITKRTKVTPHTRPYTRNTIAVPMYRWNIWCFRRHTAGYNTVLTILIQSHPCKRQFVLNFTYCYTNKSSTFFIYLFIYIVVLTY